MKKFTVSFILIWLFIQSIVAQEIIPFDTAHWDINATAYVLENYKGKDAIYIHQGYATLKDNIFLNGTIEFDIFLTERQSFPGIVFRAFDENNMESFYLRPHQSGNPDANQAAPVINGLTAWQLYFGPAYSFSYDYNFKDWTHVKLVVQDKMAQVYLDHAKTPHLSWNLKHTPREGDVAIGGSFAPMHYANFSINPDAHEIIDFHVIEGDPVEGIIQKWDVSDEFAEPLLSDPSKLSAVISARSWNHKIYVEENNAANISRVASRNGAEENTVFTRLIIESDSEQIKLFEFGYSDRVVAILNGKAIYRGTNRWRTRDYRYLGTIGLFDAIYLNLEKGENVLLLGISEDFGGWGVTGKLEDMSGIRLK